MLLRIRVELVKKIFPSEQFQRVSVPDDGDFG